jgi:hypothetical protein
VEANRQLRRFVLFAVVAAAGACSGDDDAPDQDASVETPSTTADFSHLAKCEDYFGEGVILRAAEAFDLAGCVTAEGDPAFYYPVMSEDCVDGRTLYWADDAGWGYDGEPWHTDAFTPSADELASCQGQS